MSFRKLETNSKYGNHIVGTQGFRAVPAVVTSEPEVILFAGQASKVGDERSMMDGEYVTLTPAQAQTLGEYLRQEAEYALTVREEK